ncbi:MAG: hypothetical protein JXM70_03645 [Pirellulales bacterium]|nr:hypothetical protein [Pirellulales bacterium]
METLQQAIERLEKVQPDFNYDDARTYANLIREFYSNMKAHLLSKGAPIETPLIDSIVDQKLQLPVAIEERLSRLLSEYKYYGITISKVCHWYLREAYANELGLIERTDSLYEPIIRILEMGGHFYEHHGALVLSDAATIPFIDR